MYSNPQKDRNVGNLEMMVCYTSPGNDILGTLFYLCGGCYMVILGLMIGLATFCQPGYKKKAQVAGDDIGMEIPNISLKSPPSPLVYHDVFHLGITSSYCR